MLCYIMFQNLHHGLKLFLATFQKFKQHCHASTVHQNKRLITAPTQMKFRLLRMCDTYQVDIVNNCHDFAFFPRISINNPLQISIKFSKFKKDALKLNAQGLMGIPNMVKHNH